MWQFICSPSVHRLVLSGPSTDSKGQFVCIIYLRSHYFVFVGGEVVQRSIVSCPTYIAKEKNGEGGGGVGESD